MTLNGFSLKTVSLNFLWLGSMAAGAVGKTYNMEDPNLIDISSESTLEALPQSWGLRTQNINLNSQQILKALEHKGEKIVKSKEQDIEVELIDKKSNL